LNEKSENGECKMENTPDWCILRKVQLVGIRFIILAKAPDERVLRSLLLKTPKETILNLRGK
jgi:hypothetical protein